MLFVEGWLCTCKYILDINITHLRKLYMVWKATHSLFSPVVYTGARRDSLKAYDEHSLGLYSEPWETTKNIYKRAWQALFHIYTHRVYTGTMWNWSFFLSTIPRLRRLSIFSFGPFFGAFGFPFMFFVHSTSSLSSIQFKLNYVPNRCGVDKWMRTATRECVVIEMEWSERDMSERNEEKKNIFRRNQFCWSVAMI